MQFLTDYKKIVFFSILIIIIAGVATWFNTKRTSQPVVRKIPSQLSQAATSSASTSYSNPSTQLNNDIKTTFSSSKYQDIISYTDLAASEKDPTKQYQNYKLAFAKMAKAYQGTKNKTFKLVMIELKTYMSALPGYNSSELVIPK